MASELRVNTLKDAAGNNSVAMQYVANGSAKAWVNFNGTGTVAIRDNLNVSSITDNATGQYTINLTSAMADGNGSYVFGCLTNSGGGDVRGENNVPPTTTTIHIYGLNGSQSALQDLDYIWMQAQGDLA